MSLLTSLLSFKAWSVFYVSIDSVLLDELGSNSKSQASSYAAEEEVAAYTIDADYLDHVIDNTWERGDR
ncbi:MAG: hypothetical protein KDA72_05210 [Planctomycetales bacterium]|nr:hypothetical protein [Planctomycetales bacterium]